jgi:hypothetical protein
MQVCVFYSQAGRALLSMPVSEESAPPAAIEHLAWRRLPNTTLADKLLASAAPIIEAEIGLQGYSMMGVAPPEQGKVKGWRLWRRPKDGTQ